MEAKWTQEVLQQLRQKSLSTSAVRSLVVKYNQQLEVQKRLVSESLRLERQTEKLGQELQETKKVGGGADNSVLVTELSQSFRKQQQQLDEINELTEKLKEPERRAAQLEEQSLMKDDQLKAFKEVMEDNALTVRILKSELLELQILLLKYEAQTEQLKQQQKEHKEKMQAKPREQANQRAAANTFFNSILTASSPPSSGILSSSPSSANQSMSSIRVTSGTSKLGPEKRMTAVGGSVLPPRGKPAVTVQAGSSECNSVAFSPTGTCFATGGTDRVVRVWDSITARLKTTLAGPERAVNTVDFSHNDEYLLAASNDNSTRIWSLQTGRVLHNLLGHVSKVAGACFTLDSTRVVTGSHDRTIRNWDISRGYCCRSITCENSPNDLVVSHDGNMVISGHLDGSIRVWDNRNGELANHISKLHTAKITGMAQSPDGRMILSNSRDNSLKLFDLRKGDFDVMKTFKHEDYSNGSDWGRCAFSSDGKYVVVGSTDGAIFIWNTETGNHERRMTKGHSTVVLCTAWNPNGHQIATADKAGNVSLWQA